MNIPPLQRARRGLYDLVFYDENGDRQDLAGCSILMYFKSAKTHTDAQAEFTKSIGSGLTVISESLGEVQLEVTTINTSTDLDWSRDPLAIPLYFSTVLTDAAAKTWAVNGGSGIFPIVAG